jgi:hypothetical protein
MNLYMVYPKDYDWGCFVIAENRNRAKVLITGYFNSDDHYTDYRVRTLTKGIGDKDMVIDSPDAECAICGGRNEHEDGCELAALLWRK